MTNKHEQQEKDRHQQWPDYQNQPILQDFKRTTQPEETKEKQHQHFSTLHPILKRSKKNQFHQLLKRNQQISEEDTMM